ncbi:hypothetical protein P3TCK_14263 [Photobacterium profundum 3TCK]|uniref:Uncharacterized protein n=1 Tax=Photobacterium profundum 3TCK TaxID=314280 RepID=Q1Z303_9GAMM|nr:hypothetical protein P3TCK_14263 [Photobacterium profundum 3TCK]
MGYPFLYVAIPKTDVHQFGRVECNTGFYVVMSLKV